MGKPRRRQVRDERGQVLVIVAGGMVAMIAMIGLIIDGGHAWARQRETQNGADAVAKAGTVQVQLYYSGEARTSGDVGCAVEATADQNAIEVERALYTNYLGDVLTPEIAVPPCAPGGGGAIPEAAQGVKATTTQTFATFLAGIIGFSELTATTDATAIVGAVPGICPAESGCAALPVTFPQTMGVCDSTDAEHVVRMEDGDGVWEPYELVPKDEPLTVDNLAVIPLCDAGPGSVGWINFECGANLQDEVGSPCHDYIPIPDWLKTSTGNVNAAEDEVRTYTGDVAGTVPNEGVGVPQPEDTILALPIHSNTCDVDPGPDPGPRQDWCPPSEDEDDQWQGSGDNLYYYVDLWLGFKLDAAYMKGGDTECKFPNTTGKPILLNPVPAGKVSCLKGWIVSFYTAPGGIEAVDLTPGEPGQLRVGLVN